MLEIFERLGDHYHTTPAAFVELSHEQRDKGRLKTRTLDGTELRIFLDRGKPLLVGEYLRSSCGQIIQVQGAEEPVVTAICDDWQSFSRACYHLGNRHVKIQVGDRWLRILPDHVLEDMLESLGLTLKQQTAIFVPESGAYSGGHLHGHSHGHAHRDEAQEAGKIEVVHGVSH